MELILASFLDLFSIANFSYIAFGVTLGIVAGAIPGLSGITAIAIAIPFTIYLNPLAGIAFLIAITKGSTVGGSISAILLNTPGTVEATATTYDGYPLAKKGNPIKALSMALYSSVSGDMFSDILLIIASATLASFALKIGPVEFLACVVLSFIIIAVFSSESIIKGLIVTFFGVFLSMIGLDPETGTERLTFGIISLMGGVSLFSLGIGTLALGELIVQIEQHTTKENDGVIALNDQRVSWSEYKAVLPTIFRSGLIGSFVGMIPGLGAIIAGFLGYNAAKARSSNPEMFGKGSLEGIAAVQAANSAVCGANLIPLLLLGIPGNVAAAFLVGAFMIHGLTPGPLIFETSARFIYGLFGAMLIANVFNLFIGHIGMHLWAQITRIPLTIVFPVIILFCITGTYITEDDYFAVGIMLIFGVLAYLMRKLQYPFVPFIVAFILAQQFEIGLRQTVTLTKSDPMYFLDHPIAIIVILISMAFLGVDLSRRIKMFVRGKSHID